MMKALLTLAIVMVILFAVYLVERICDRYRPATGMWPRILIALMVAFCIGLAAVKAAGAVDLKLSLNYIVTQVGTSAYDRFCCKSLFRVTNENS